MHPKNTGLTCQQMEGCSYYRARTTFEARVKHPLLFFLDIQTASFLKKFDRAFSVVLPENTDKHSITEFFVFVNQPLVQFNIFLAFCQKICYN